MENIPLNELIPFLDKKFVQLEREPLEKSLLAFVKHMWPVIEPSRDFVTGWVVEAICDHLEAVTNGHIRRLLINVPPGFTKSTLVGVMWPAWEWGPRNMPSNRYICASYSEHLTVRDNMRCKNIVMSDRYQRLWGDRFEIASDLMSKIKFGNTATGWKLATSVGGVGVGERGDRFIIDDPHNTMEMESEASRRNTEMWFTEVVPDRLNNQQTSAIVVIMQRLHEDDVSGIAISRNMGYDHLMIPMRHDIGRHCITRLGWEDCRTEDGELAWPERFPDQTVDELERDKGPYAFCSSQEAPVLMADLSMKRIDEIAEGDKVIGFNIGNNENRARLTEAQVLGVSKSRRELVKITLNSGEVIRCTADHKWWTGRNNKAHVPYASGRVGSTLYRLCPPRLPELNAEQTRIAGWLSGFFDGEGNERIVSVEPDGVEDVYGLETTTGNYFVWGLASSNSSQYQQSPEPRGGSIIKRDYWKPWTDTVYPACEYILASLDTAYGTKESNDPSALTIWGVYREDHDTVVNGVPVKVKGNTKVILLYAWRKRLEFNDLIQEVINTCTRDKRNVRGPRFNVDRVIVEAKASGMSVAQELRRLCALTGQFGVEMIKLKGSMDKVSRLHSIQHLFAEGMVHAPYLVEANDWREFSGMVIDEIAIFPHGSHDDLVDSTSMALRYLRDNGFMVREEEKKLDDMEEMLYRGRELPLYPV